MLKSYSLFKTESEMSPASIESDHDLNVVETLWASPPVEKNDALYSQLVYKVQRDPQHLISHVQRIYYTYHHKMSDPLYAAFVDFLLVLDGGGKDLITRLLSQTKTTLLQHHYQLIVRYLNDNNTDLLVGNKYTVLTDGALQYAILKDKIEETAY